MSDAGVLGLTHFKVQSWGLVLYQTSLGAWAAQMWAGRWRECSLTLKASDWCQGITKTQLPRSFSRRTCPKHRGLFVCGRFVHWGTSKHVCRHCPWWSFLLKFLSFHFWVVPRVVWPQIQPRQGPVEARGLTATSRRWAERVHSQAQRWLFPWRSTAARIRTLSD